MNARRLFSLAVVTALVGAASPSAAQSVAVGDNAPAVTLPTLGGDQLDLAETFAKGKTVLVVLRGFPGYQCPLCSRQADDYIKSASRFADAGIDVVLVYPGLGGQLDVRAEQFLGDRELPSPITMVLDRNFALTDAYGLRWDAPRETAYPSTFVVGEDGVVEWAKTSKTHAGRVSAADALAAATE